MNIKQAKEQIKKTMQLYFLKDELGNYILSKAQQRPVFLMGPPGIGKTAIMQQIAAELKVGLVSYSMTHHTRQSALGLPYIVDREFQGKTYSTAEYTMSEIIASVYREMENSGCEEGILFLDEINCVSETLAPAMLQFLQYKTFGMHGVPDGWLIVTAGNPPEYNASAREFDMATWDRMKRIDVEPDLNAWKDYARERGVHPAVRSYLELHPEQFYAIERTLDGQEFVTARGWEDLSAILSLHDRAQMEVDAELFGQYLQHERIAEEFAIFFELYCKYQADYQIGHILAGEASDELVQRAKDAALDERIMVVGMLNDAVVAHAKAVMQTEDQLIVLRDWLKAHKEVQGDLVEALREAMEAENGRAVYGTLYHDLAVGRIAAEEQFAWLKARFQESVGRLKEEATIAGTEMEHALLFAEKVYGSGVELLMILAELTENEFTNRYIARYGCEVYYRCSKELMLQDRLNQIAADI